VVIIRSGLRASSWSFIAEVFGTLVISAILYLIFVLAR
jgi:hypothetical protein